MTSPRPRATRLPWPRPALILILSLLLLLPSQGSLPVKAQGPAPQVPARTGSVAPVPVPSPRTAPRATVDQPAHPLPFLTPHPQIKARSAAASSRAATGARAAPESATSPLTANLTTAFEGMSFNDSGGYEPPDTSIAVGPNHVLETVNVEGRITDKSGNELVTWNLQDWINLPASYTVGFPKVLFDRVSDRWLIAFAGANNYPWTSATQGYVWLIISNTGDPTGSWYEYTFPYTNLPDFPGFAISDDKIVLTSNGYDFSTTASVGADTLVINKAQAYAAANNVPYTYFAPDSTYFTIQPAQTLTTGNDLYMASVPWVGYGQGTTSILNVFRVEGVPGVSSVTRGLNVLAMPYGVATPPDAEQAGTSETIRTNDNRLLSAVWHSNHLWFASTTGCIPGGDSTDRACVYWATVDTTNPASPSLSDWGTFSLAGYDYYFPAITVDGAGSAYLVCNRSGASEYVGLRQATRRAGQSFSGSSLLHAGAIAYVTSNNQRWGDYAGAVPDPSDASAAWVAGEYAKGPAANLWGTYLARLSDSASPATTWYFAEGYTGTGFDEYLTLQNPNPDAAGVLLTYYLASGGPITRTLSVAGNARSTVAVHDTSLGVGRGQAVSTKVTANRPIVVERPMYFSYGPDGWTGGHVVMGTTSLAYDWYFAEGYTGSDFDEYLTILNPGPTAANITLTYYLASGGPISKTFTVQGRSRFTLAVYDPVLGVGRGQAVSARVNSDQPIVAERPMYFSYGPEGWTGGHVAMGATGLALNWYFAEGYTAPGFDEYITIQNPNSATATVVLTYYLASGDPILKYYTVPGQSRSTLAVHEADLGVGRNQAVSIRVDSDQPIVAERSMYFSYGTGGWTGGHDVMGATTPSATWYFAEGYTGAGFDEYLTLQNPNLGPATATITYLLGAGSPIVKTHPLPALSRQTIKVNDEVGPNQAVSMKVESTLPVVAERPMYFSYGAAGWTGGHDAMGYSP